MAELELFDSDNGTQLYILLYYSKSSYHSASYKEVLNKYCLVISKAPGQTSRLPHKLQDPQLSTHTLIHTPLKAAKQLPTSRAAFLQLNCCRGMTSTKPPLCSEGLGRQVGFPVSTLGAAWNSACPMIHAPKFREQRGKRQEQKKKTLGLWMAALCRVRH